VHFGRIIRAARRESVRRRAAVLLLSGLSLLAPVTPAFAQDAHPAPVNRDQAFAAFITAASQRFRIPEVWIRAVMHAESENADDVSSAGAMGLMQIMPDTWAVLRAQYRLGSDPFDPHDNIFVGAAYLRAMLDRYGNIGAMLAAYNAGPSRYDDYLATGRVLPAETRDYVAKLAPILGGTPLQSSTGAVPSTPVDWRDAPLFVVSANGPTAARSVQPDRPSAAMELSTPASRDAPDGTSMGGIFVTISGSSSTP